MRIIKRSFKKDGEGYIVIIPTDDQDLWHVYNLIQVGDCIKMSTVRKVTKESVTGVTQNMKRRLVLTLAITNINYFSEGDRLTISIKGKNATQNDYLQIGQFHTFQVELNQKVTISKECWGGFQRNLLKELQNEENDSEVAAVVMDQGVAHICYVKNSMTLLKQKVQKNIAKKSAGEEIHTKSLRKFFQECYKAIKTIEYSRIKCLIIASPGFVNQQFLKYLKEVTMDENEKQLRKQMQKFLLVKTSTGYLQSLNQVLADPKVLQRLKDTKAIRQIKALQKFFNVMKVNINKIAYGEKDIFQCNKQQAIQTLLISDSLFRTKDLNKRKIYNKLVEEVKKKNGQVFVFSSLHQSGAKLNSLTGLAAILKFQVQLDEQEDQQNQIEPLAEEEQVKINQDLIRNMKEISDQQEDFI